MISTFLGLLRTLAPTEPVLLLGILECEIQYVDPQMIRDLFGFSKKNSFEIQRPDRVGAFAPLQKLLDGHAKPG